MKDPIDLGVVIERVVVVVGQGAPREGRARSDEEPRPQAGPRAADHRVVLRELRIETDARVSAADARRLGEAVAARLAERLAELQDRRRDAILDGRSTGGRVRIGEVCARLTGDAADHASAGGVADEVGTALERKVNACLQ